MTLLFADHVRALPDLCVRTGCRAVTLPSTGSAPLRSLVRERAGAQALSRERVCRLPDPEVRVCAMGLGEQSPH